MFRSLKLFVHDAVGIFGFALSAALMPQRLATRWLAIGAALHQGHPDVQAAAESVARCWPERPLDRRAFRYMTLAEAMAAWRLMLGRRLDIDRRGAWPEAPGFVAVGGHYGIGIAVLWDLREAGCRPRFLLHPPNPGQRRRRPLGYVWSRLRFRLVRRLCPDGPIVTPGARASLERILDEQRATPVLLLDTPSSPAADRRDTWALRAGACRIDLRRGARDLLECRSARVAYFWATMHPRTGRIRIDIEAPTSPVETSWPEHASEVLERDPAQWQLWPFVGGLLQDRSESGEAGGRSR